MDLEGRVLLAELAIGRAYRGLSGSSRNASEIRKTLAMLRELERPCGILGKMGAERVNAFLLRLRNSIIPNIEYTEFKWVFPENCENGRTQRRI